MNQNHRIEEEAKAVAKSGVKLLISVAIAAAATFVFMIIAGRILGTLEYGVFSEVWTILILISSVLSTGPIYSVTKYVPEYLSLGERQNAKIVLITAFRQSLLGGSVCGVGLWLGSGFIGDMLLGWDTIPKLRIVFLSLPLFTVMPVFLASFVGYRWLEHHIVANTVGSVVKLSLVPVLLITAGIYGGLACLVIGTAVTIGVSLFSISWKLRLYPREFFKLKESAISKKVFHFSLPLFITALSGIALRQGYILFIGVLNNKEASGLFSAAFILTSPIYMVMAVFGTSLIPTFSKFFTLKSKPVLSGIQSIYIKYLLWLVLPIIAVYLALPEAVLRLSYGEAYVSASNVLRYLGSSFLAMVLYVVFSSFLYGAGKTWDLLKVSVGSLISCFVLGVPLIELFGIDGAGMASLISSCVQVILSIIYTHKLIKPDYSKVQPLIPFVAFGVNLLVLFYFRLF